MGKDGTGDNRTIPLETSPSYIQALLRPSNNGKANIRRVWSIALETVWLPLFHATNVMGDTAIPAEALGCPIRLAYDKDGGVKFSKSGRPVTRVAKEISETVTLVRENMVANLQDFTHQVAEAKPDQYNASIQNANTVAKPIIQKDKIELDKAVKAQLAEAIRKAEAEKPIKEAVTA